MATDHDGRTDGEEQDAPAPGEQASDAEDIAAERAERIAAEDASAADPSALETGDADEDDDGGDADSGGESGEAEPERRPEPGGPVPDLLDDLPEGLPPEQRHLFEETLLNGIPVVTPAPYPALPPDTTGSHALSSISDYAPPEGWSPPEGAAEHPDSAPPEAPEPVSDYAPPENAVPPEAPRRPDSGGPVTPASGTPMHFTPTAGVPRIKLTPGAPGSRPWPERMRVLLRTPMSERGAFERSSSAERGEGEAAAVSVPRVLDVTLRIGELLLASGEAAEDVEAAMLGVTHALGLDRCEPTVTFTLLSISYHPSLVETPVTAERVVRRRGSDYTRLAAVYQLVDDITAERATVEEAYRRLADIRRNRHPYPGWMLAGANGLLSGSASVMVGGDFLVFCISFFASTLGDRLAWILADRGFPEFYQYVLAAIPSALMATVFAALGPTLHVHFAASAIITGGLFALIPGRPLVAAVQDGLTGYYITASARLLEVMYLFIGIVCGIAAMLYLSQVAMHVRLTQVDSAPATAAHLLPWLQLIAAGGLTIAFCVLMQNERSTLLWATANGMAGWAVYGALRWDVHLSQVVATGAGAMLVSLFGQLLARYHSTSSLPYVVPAFGPLLPGSALYYGLLGFTQGHTDKGLLEIIRAGALALALAVGVSLGGELARLFLPVIRTEGVPAKRRAAKRTRGF